MAIEIVDFPINSMVISHCYVSSPEVTMILVDNTAMALPGFGAGAGSKTCELRDLQAVQRVFGRRLDY